jgi:hypothetical protein
VNWFGDLKSKQTSICQIVSIKHSSLPTNLNKSMSYKESNMG